MASYIHNLSIGNYRGINSMVISELNNINIIVGDNNSGKTSLLETIFLLRAPESFANVLSTAKLRTTGFLASTTPYENFISIFPKGSNQIFVQADGDFGNVSLKVSGEEITTEVGDDDLKNYPASMRYVRAQNIVGSEVTAFVGQMSSSVNSHRDEFPIRFTAISRNHHAVVTSRRFINIEYVSPIAHITENTFNRIVRTEGYKQICIELIRLFDPQIEDLIYMRNELSGKAVEYIKNSKLGLMPLSTYGDGIKKVLSLANAIVESAGGILLIDEIDTSIHYKYYENIFNFLIKACMKFDVQVFITTHSKEAIDEMLKTQNYGEKNHKSYDPINVITFRKDENGNIRSRSMSGYDVHSNRELFDFEVRL